MRISNLLLTFALTVFVTGISAADGPEDSSQNEKKISEKGDDLEALRRAADAEAEKEPVTDESAEDQTFKSGNLGLQALNPEISVTGDMLGRYQSDEADITWDSGFRGLGIHCEAYLDPYSRFKAAVPISSEGAELGEAYFTRYGLIGSTNITLGKFRQQFGVVNRWHKHGLDWFDFPLALRSIFGPGGLNQIGLSLQTSGTTGLVFHGLIVEVTDGDNPRMFGQNSKNRPSILARYNIYRDLSPSTYLEIGLTGLAGWNDSWTVLDSRISDMRSATVSGIDLSLLWEPTGRMRYRNLQWRSEAYFADKAILAPDGSGPDRLKPWGLYSLLQAKVSRSIEIGARYDHFKPEAKDYACLGEISLAPLAVSENGAYQQLIGAWLTWWQSPFVKFRGGYTFNTSVGMDHDVHSVTLQMVFAAGPHKHERY